MRSYVFYFKASDYDVKDVITMTDKELLANCDYFRINYSNSKNGYFTYTQERYQMLLYTRRVCLDSLGVVYP